MHNAPLSFLVYLPYFKNSSLLNRCELYPCIYDVFDSESALELNPEVVTLTPGTPCVCFHRKATAEIKGNSPRFQGQSHSPQSLIVHAVVTARQLLGPRLWKIFIVADTVDVFKSIYKAWLYLASAFRVAGVPFHSRGKGWQVMWSPLCIHED
jgi:hypothetical protein